jgi:hypothetical protein
VGSKWLTTWALAWPRYLSNIMVITTTVWEDVMLQLLIEWICEVCLWDGLSWHDTHTKFHEDWLVQAFKQY